MRFGETYSVPVSAYPVIETSSIAPSIPVRETSTPVAPVAPELTPVAAEATAVKPVVVVYYNN